MSVHADTALWIAIWFAVLVAVLAFLRWGGRPRQPHSGGHGQRQVPQP
jgi:predicted secreted protein